jgi:uncharacterized membrane protein YfcA
MTALQDVFSIEGFIFIVLATFVAGLVRGFAGFGTAMIYLPVASQFIPPVWALTAMVLFDVIGPLPNMPRAIREGHPRDVIRLAVGLSFGLPLGVYFLTVMSPEFFRYSVSILALTLLVLLMSGFRYKGTLTKPLIFGTGGLGGFLAGVSGLAGPPVIMLYMASTQPAKVIRANTTLYLLLADVATLVLFGIWGLLHSTALLIGLALIIPYSVATMIGAALFDPSRETLYRWIAYGIIATSAVSGMPIWD